MQHFDPWADRRHPDRGAAWHQNPCGGQIGHPGGQVLQACAPVYLERSSPETSSVATGNPDVSHSRRAGSHLAFRAARPPLSKVTTREDQPKNSSACPNRSKPLTIAPQGEDGSVACPGRALCARNEESRLHSRPIRVLCGAHLDAAWSPGTPASGQPTWRWTHRGLQVSRERRRAALTLWNVPQSEDMILPSTTAIDRPSRTAETPRRKEP
jgi:hypothetical protein